MQEVLLVIKNNIQGAMQADCIKAGHCRSVLPNFLNTKTAQVVPIHNDLISKYGVKVKSNALDMSTMQCGAACLFGNHC